MSPMMPFFFVLCFVFDMQIIAILLILQFNITNTCSLWCCFDFYYCLKLLITSHDPTISFVFLLCAPASYSLGRLSMYVCVCAQQRKNCCKINYITITVVTWYTTHIHVELYYLWV